MKRPMMILVQRSRRPRRWAGVAMFAAMLAGVLWLEHRHVAPAPLDSSAPPSQESFESVLGRHAADDDHSAQLTDFAFKSSDSTEGATPTR